MYIRKATPDDNAELIELQTKCSQGTTIIVSTVNTPDFFARAKVYEDYMVYFAHGLYTYDNSVKLHSVSLVRLLLCVCSIGYLLYFYYHEFSRLERGKTHQNVDDTMVDIVLRCSLFVTLNKVSILW